MTHDLAGLIARESIIDCVNRLFINTDSRDWAGVEQCFADTVLFDMTSLAGGRPSTMTPRQIVEGWEAGLRPITAMHHQAGNHRVEIRGSKATAFCYGIAIHYRPTSSGHDTRTFVGSYDFDLVDQAGDWRIVGFRFNLKFIEGNLNLDTAE